MLVSKFRLTLIISLCGLFAVILLSIAFASIPILVVGIILVICFQQTFYIYGMFSSRTNFFFKTVKGKEYFGGKPGILFRFDDGPDPVYTPQILDILKAEGIQALFAVMGKNAEKYPGIVKRMQQENHIIANHTYSHPYNILLMGYKRVFQEIARTDAIIRGITGVKPKYFCPPIGFKNFIMGKAIRELELIPVMWDIRTLDTHSTAEKIMERIRRQLKTPAIIMFHDAILPMSKNDREATVQALKETIRFLKDKRYI